MSGNDWKVTQGMRAVSWMLAALFAAALLTPPASAAAESARVTVTKRGPGNGRVVPEASWTPGTAHDYPEGERVVLRAEAAAHSRFLRWEGDLPGDCDASRPEIAVSASGQMEITAVFDRDTVRLAVSRTGDPAGGGLLPPPGEYLFRRGDVVLLQALPWDPCNQVAWTGPVEGSGTAVTVVMEGDVEVGASFLRESDPSAGSPVTVEVSEDGVPAFYACMAGGDLFGWLAVTAIHGDHWGAGITKLCDAQHPWSPVFETINLNFEHVLNGDFEDRRRQCFTPRHDPMRVEVFSPAQAAVAWPAETASWAMDCRAVYTFPDGPFVDVAFEVTPRADEAPLGYLAFMWASYMDKALSPEIRFPGPGGGWSAFGEMGDAGRPQTGTVARDGVSPLALSPEFPAFNLVESGSVRFSRPFYYGLVDGDGFAATRDDPMALVMMFRETDETRFALWNWGERNETPAWDWQWVLRTPKIGVKQELRARMAYLPFESDGAVQSLFDAWSPESPAVPAVHGLRTDGQVRVLASPAEKKSNPVSTARALAAAGDRTGAFELLARAAAVPMHEPLACDTLEEVFTQGQDPEGRAAFWGDFVRDHPGIGGAHARLGKALIQAGRPEAAEEVLLRALALSPGDLESGAHLAAVQALRGETEPLKALPDRVPPEARGLARLWVRDWSLLGQRLLDGPDPAAAAALFRCAAVLDPEELWHRIQLGQALARTGDPEGALAEYRAVLASSPEDEFTGGLVDAVYQDRGDSAGRIAEWRAALAAHPDSPSALWRLGAALMDAGARDEAAAPLAQAIGRNPSLFEARVRFASLLAEKGDLAGAAVHLDVLMSLSGPEGKTAAEVLGRAGRRLLEGPNPDAAAALFRCAAALDPEELWHRIHLGQALARTGDTEGALAEYRAVLARSSEDEWTGGLVDTVCQDRKGLEGCVAEWRAAVAARPLSAMAHRRLGAALLAQGALEESERSLEKALEISPGHPEADACLHALRAARGEEEAARLYLERMRAAGEEQGKTAAGLWARAGEGLLRSGDGTRAAALFRGAAALDGGELWHRIHLGEALALTGDTEGALAEYRAVLAKFPEAERTGDLVDELYIKSGDAEGRVREWERMTREHPGCRRCGERLAGALAAAGGARATP